MGVARVTVEFDAQIQEAVAVKCQDLRLQQGSLRKRNKYTTTPLYWVIENRTRYGSMSLSKNLCIT